jgi:hypothetical protein
MQVRGVVISVEFDVQVAKKDGGAYPGARFTYRDEQGKVAERGFHNNTFKYNASLKTQLSNLNPNDKFIMEMEKEGEFWNVKSVVVDVGQGIALAPVNAAGKAVPHASPKSTYETPEERARKQILIVRQSSFTSAMTLLGTKAKTAADVIPVAKEIEAYIYGEDFDGGMPLNMKNDVI